MNPNIKEIIEVPLGIEAHRLAKQFAAEQGNPEKRKQVYLNTLAVYAVHRYLQWLQIETNLTKSDSWNPLLRSRWNVADLWIPGIGKLECRPVLPEDTVIDLPPEVTEDRMGYMGIQFSERLDYVQLLGFQRGIDLPIDSRQILISELQPLESFLNYLNYMELEFGDKINVALWLKDQRNEVALRLGWEFPAPLTPMATSGWRFIEPFDPAIAQLRDMGREIPEPARGNCKTIYIDQTPLQLLAVTWGLPPEADTPQKWSLWLILRMQSGGFLPRRLKLQIRDKTQVLQEKELDTDELYLFAPVVGNLEDEFIVKLSLNDQEQELEPFIFAPEQSGKADASN